MPSPNAVRWYIENGFYHVYNRGVEKRIIFLDTSDYKMFLFYLFIYLAPPDLVRKTYPDLKAALKNGNMHAQVTLHAYTLMPNHFHFLIQQAEKTDLTCFMRRLTNAYTRYFNEKYARVGGLFQGVFKASLIETDAYLLEVNRYIHRNPKDVLQNKMKLDEYLWSSYRIYLGLQKSAYIQSDYILGYFSKKNINLSYQSFVEMYEESSLPAEYIFDE